MSDADSLQSTISRVLAWGVVGGVVAFGIIFFWASSGASMSIRMTTALLCAGGGFIAGALFSLVVVADDSH